MDTLKERLDRGEVMILDGAMGTELERKGVPMHGMAWSAAALQTHPDVVRQVHEDYIRAGADIIITNTFATARHTLEYAGMGDLVRRLNTRAVVMAQNAREAAAAAAAGDRQVFIAGSISTFDPGLKSELRPSEQQARANYREQAHLLAEAGVDLIMLEMMRDVEQSAYAIEAAVSTGVPTWVGFSCRLNEDGSEVLLLGSQGETFAEALDALAPLGGSVVSVMHTRVEDTTPALAVVQQHWKGPVGSYPHSGEFVMPNWQFVNIISPQEFLVEAQKWVQTGIQVVGGCCGLGPEHIRVLREHLPTHLRTSTL